MNLTTARPNILAIAALVLATSAAVVTAAAPLPAFPGAEGFGATATGGRGGVVYHVTTLDDAGPGSFRDAVSQPNRTVVFDVAGTVRLASPVSLASDLTVAGQTAPAPGITLLGHGISLSNQKNVILRHLRLRAGIASGRGSKVLNVSAGSEMIFDHLSISWGRWDDVGFTQGAHDITLQDSIVAEAIDPQRFGALIDSALRITVTRTLWADNQSRNPKGKAHLQYVNNVVYNWGGSGYCGGHSGAVWNQDLVNNYFVAGPDSSVSGTLAQFTANDHVHHSGNLLDTDKDGALNGRPVGDADFKDAHGGEGPTFSAEPANHPAVPVTAIDAAGAFQKVVATAGASLYRDAADLRVIDQVRSLGTKGAIIHDESAVSAAPAHGSPVGATTATASADADRDGIPDTWESAHHLDPRDASDAARLDPTTGYTHVELYVNSLCK